VTSLWVGKNRLDSDGKQAKGKKSYRSNRLPIVPAIRRHRQRMRNRSASTGKNKKVSSSLQRNKSFERWFDLRHTKELDPLANQDGGCSRRGRPVASKPRGRNSLTTKHYPAWRATGLFAPFLTRNRGFVLDFARYLGMRLVGALGQGRPQASHFVGRNGP
jgi:hypothetical protein